MTVPDPTRPLASAWSRVRIAPCLAGLLAILPAVVAPAAAQDVMQDGAAQAALLPAPFPPPVAAVAPFGAALPPPAVYLAPLAPRPAGPAVAVPSADQQDLRPPSIALDGLFAAIGAAHVFDDAKTVADAIPDEAPDALLADYDAQKARPGFVLKDFVAQHFSVAPRRTVSYRRRPNESVRDYITGMWEVLSRPPDTLVAHSSLLPLPYTYVVPGGRFSEMYYWDSYFTMIGLYEDGRIDLMRSMVRDIASLIDRYGHMPNGNRTYYLGRSEPPFFALMVDLLAMHDGQVAYTTFLPQLQREYDYWMDGAAQVAPGGAYRHVVRLPDGTLMNRHWDDLSTPRDESYPQDIATAAATNRPAAEVYRDLRAGGETGWDFSSRWLADGHTLSSIHTTDLLPIELNCLIAHLEQTLSHAYALNGNTALSARYTQEAATRVEAIRRLLWDDRQGAFFDYDWKKGALSPVLSGATVMPLFLQMATPDQAKAVAATLRARLLKIGGLATTDRVSGQQWDSPNGWAPTQWMAIKGLNQYGIDDLAQEIATRWMERVIGTYEKSGVLLEKYDVVNPAISPTGGKGGGEYPMQVGFGWTNGTLLGLMNRYPQDTRVVLDRNPRADQPTARPLPPVNAYDVKGPVVDPAPVPMAQVPPAPVPPAAPGRPSGPADAAQPVQGHDGDGQKDGGPGLVHGSGPGGHDQQQGGDPQRVLDQHGPAQ
ncbi:trehalase [Gluconacetobacter johannae DSM 13595]|nr:trehalase [Gluconacetobacter johannae DSM 13595]